MDDNSISVSGQFPCGRKTSRGPTGLRTRPLLGALLIAVALAACSTPQEAEPTPTSLPMDIPTATPTSTATAAPTLTPTPTPLPTYPPPTPLSTMVARPTAAPTPFPDEQDVVKAVLGTGNGDHWAGYRAPGSFTAPGAREQLALVGNIGDRDEFRWVVIGRAEGDWQLRGTSESLGTGFAAPPPQYVMPYLVDFDGDDQQEALTYYFRMQRGWMASADSLYRWNGGALARIWGMTTLVDNKTADALDVPTRYRQVAQVDWKWEDLDQDGVDEILARDRVAFFLPGEEGYVRAGTSSVGEESGHLAFRWDGSAFRPFAPSGPSGMFAYTVRSDLWLWEDRAGRPLKMASPGTSIKDLAWSPDGRWLAWRAEPFGQAGHYRPTIGLYDAETGRTSELAVDEHPAELNWIEDGRLAYAFSVTDQPRFLLDPETREQNALPNVPFDSWSLIGSRLIYGHEKNLYRYDLASERGGLLITGPNGAGHAAPGAFGPVGSPRGDWIACYLADRNSTWVGLVSPHLAEPLDGFAVSAPFIGREAPELQLAWSPDGSHLAVLASDREGANHPTVLHIARVPAGTIDPIGRFEWQQALRSEAPAQAGTLDPVGRLEWREALRLEATAQTAGPAWSPDGLRLAIAAGSEVWETAVSGEATLRHRFSFPDVEWTTLAWSPDGTGYLAGLRGESYDGWLYWFPAVSADPVLLQIDLIGVAHWSARIIEAPGQDGIRSPTLTSRQQLRQ